MKKIILLGIATFLAIGLYSNPNPGPEVHINEFMFTGPNSWSIELLFYYGDWYNFDSITVQSNSGTARIINGYGQLFSFTNQDLSQQLVINPNGDIIVLTGYSAYYPPTSCELTFGNVTNPDVVAPLSGQSIERFEPGYYCNPFFPPEIFSITNNPTMYFPNDTTGTFGTMQGIIFDMEGLPVPNQVFRMDFPFTTDASGHYSTRIYSRIFSWDTICYERWPNHFSPVQLSPISYTMLPDSVITRDIHLLSALLVGISPQPMKTGSDFNVFPNPVTNAITVSYTSDLTADSGDLHIDIYDMNGKKVLKKDLENRLGVINIPIDLANGIYIANLSREGKIIGSARFIVNKAE
ncbi:MAG: T9SS type A sorting domain-containing protein [Bacteroidales bacterium]|jgi:hypothetical protein